MGDVTPSQSPNHSLCICIVGGGFGGLYTALYLQKYRHLRNSRIVLIEPKDRFLFTPMMYELITDELKEWEIAPTYSSLIAGKNIDWMQTRAEAIDLRQKTVTVVSGKTFAYDYLVMATGAKSRSFPIPGVAEHTLTFRTFEDSQRLSAQLAQLVQARQLQSHGGRMDPIHVTVVGGGASGVELACKVSDYFRAVESRIKGRQSSKDIEDYLTVRLVEHGDTLLGAFEDGIRQQANRALAHRNVAILMRTGVSAVTAGSVTLKNADKSQASSEEAQIEQEQTVHSHLTLWAAGTQPRSWLGLQSVEQNKQGQRLTRRSLQLREYDNVFVLGDSAEVRGPKDKRSPSTAQAAFQAADKVAANIASMAKGRPPKPFNYLHLGNMITLGIGDAGLHSFGITLGGRLAALCRRGVYIFRMPTRRHQLKVARRAIGELFRTLLPPW